MKKIWMSIILMTVLGMGCQKSIESGLLKDYTRLERSDETTLIYKSSSTPLDGYKAIKVNTVDVSLTKPSQRVIEDLRQYVDLSIRKVVLSEYDIAEENGEKTAVLSSRLFYCKDSSQAYMESGYEDFVGPCLEVRISDSLTDKTLISMILKRPAIADDNLDKWSRAKMTIEYWAENLAVALYCNDEEPCDVKKHIDAAIAEEAKAEPETEDAAQNCE
ncbi:MAG: DUF3313 family protein [Sedimentisphaeraceae bacterium JB056]